MSILCFVHEIIQSQELHDGDAGQKVDAGKGDAVLLGACGIKALLEIGDFAIMSHHVATSLKCLRIRLSTGIVWHGCIHSQSRP